MNNRKDVLDLMKKPKLRKGEEYHRGTMKAFCCWHGATVVWLQCSALGALQCQSLSEREYGEKVEEVVEKQMSL